MSGRDGGGPGLTVYDHDPSMNAGDESRQYLFDSKATLPFVKEEVDHEVVVKTAKSKVRSSSKPSKKKTPSRSELEESMM